MTGKMKKVILCVTVAAVLLVSVAALAVSLYSGAVVSFTGIQLSVSSSGDTQGFVDITLKNIDTTGVSFCLQYDKDLIELSEVDTNTPIQNNVAIDGSGTQVFNFEHKYFEQNTTAFPDAKSFMDLQELVSFGVINAPIIGIADTDKGYLVMNFIPDEANMSNSSYLGYVTQDGNEKAAILANTADGKGVKLGRLSFKIKDAATFSKLSQSQIDNLIKVVPFENMPGIIEVDSSTQDNGVLLCYLDENGKLKWYSNQQQNIDYDMDLNPDLLKVEPQVSSLEVTSYEIYKNGTSQDLIDFLNEKMYLMTLCYADGSQVPVVFNWDNTASIDNSWNVKGGDTTYTVTQKYNDDFNVTVTVKVLSVTLIGFDTDNENIVYSAADPNFPTTLADLELADKAHPVLDRYIPNGGIKAFDITWYSYGGAHITDSDPLPITTSSVGQSFTFTGNCPETATITSDYPWLTTSNPLPEILQTRSVVASDSDLPDKLEYVSSSRGTNGELIIKVQYTSGTIQPGTEFKIKMPGGELIDQTKVSVNVSIAADGSCAEITVSPDITVPDQEKTAKVVNLGSRAGTFQIAAVDPTKGESNYASFNPDPRRNIYEGTTDYSFDYSALSSAMFPVTAGGTLPNTITLPISSVRIITTYSGYDGSETGALATFTVDGWTTTSTAGNVVTVKGRLADTSYTNYGQVYNDNNLNIEISYYTETSTATESISDIGDFEYNIQQVGYDYDHLQTHTFTVTNNGQTDLYGLSAVITFDTANNQQEAFVITKELPSILAKGQSANLDITTRIGMPISAGALPDGKYVSTVSIYSNNQLLDTFNITFEVSEDIICTVVVEVPDAQKTFGTVGNNKQQKETYTAPCGGTVTITAVPEVDCEFTGWVVTKTKISNSLTLTSTEEMTTPLTITIPADETEINIQATFKETIQALLRLKELKVMDSTPTEQTPLYTISSGGQWTSAAFDPATREYYVAVPNDIDKVNLWFTLRDEAETFMQNSVLTLEFEYTDNTSTTHTSNPPKVDSYYKTDYYDPLEESPTDNTAILRLIYDDPSSGIAKTTVEYTIHIYRKLTLSQLVTFNPGNSPAGLYTSDSSITNVADAIDQFKTTDNFTFTVGNTPAGGTAGTVYHAEAWGGGVNYDLIDTALFVINSSDFDDPGYSVLQNSIGGTPGTVTKTTKVNICQNTVASNQTGSSDDFNFISSNELVTLSSSGTITELSGKRVRPGRYELTYTFDDFDGQPVSVSRPLIILNPIGDVNANKTADETDSSRIVGRFKDDCDLADNITLPSYGNDGLLNKYRVCDVNKDGIVNAIDANYIRAGDKIVQYYTNYQSNATGGGT